MNKVIRISPTTHDGTVADNGLFFDITELPNATSKLGGTVLLKSVTSQVVSNAGHPQMDLLFFKKKAALTLGDLGSALSALSGAAIKTNELIGVVSMPTVPADGSADLEGLFVSSNLNIDLVLEADDNKQSIYVASIVRAQYVSDTDTNVTLSFGFEQ